MPFRPPLSVQELRMQRRLLAVYHKLICIGLAASDSTMPPSEVRKQLEPLTDEASSVMKGWTWQPRQG